jgi:hypothetical protein
VRLDRLRARNKALLLDELSLYRHRGRFPLNHDVRGRAVPKFIDSHGTRCAVAHLIEISGQHELVRQIAKTRNGARVRELARVPELRAWLDAAGLSVDEAARIQPEYCFVTQAEACFCDHGPLSTLAIGTIVGLESASIRVRVDRIEGELMGFRVGDEQSVQAWAG